jgi:glycosyltransferase involved in cell wall biosynthesis
MATEYLAELGARRNRIITSSNAVDSEHFAPNKELRHQVRSRNQVHEKIVVLFSGQLIRRKGLETLISAISRLGSSIVLWVVGAGEGRARYESLAQKLIPNRSRFFGHLAYDTLNEVLNASDMLVMPSLEEVWGLVLNEAMSAGVPVIASSRAGATADLVVPGETGLSVEPEDVPALAKAIEQLALDDSLRHTLGENARSRVLLRGTKEYAQDIAMAVRL